MTQCREADFECYICGRTWPRRFKRSGIFLNTHVAVCEEAAPVARTQGVAFIKARSMRETAKKRGTMESLI